MNAAERALSAPVSEIGLEVSNLFPRINLTGSVGISAQEIGALPTGDALQFSFGPSISWSPFDLIRGEQRIDAAASRSDAAFVDYEQTVLRALEDLQRGLALQASAIQRREAQATS